MVYGIYWGQIGFDDCKAEREWSAVEIEILRSLADVVGAAIMRARYVEELTDAATPNRPPAMGLAGAPWD